MRRFLEAGVLLLVGVVLAHWHVGQQTYYPVVRVAAGDDVVYTAVLDPLPERRACGEATKRFLAPVKEDCRECSIVFARCERELKGMAWAAAGAADPVPYPFVAVPGLRVVVEGEEAAARASCDRVAQAAVRRGIVQAACVYQATGSHS